MLEKTAEDLDSWRSQMKAYQKNKRTKKPFGKQVPVAQHVTHQDIKYKQTLFNPILQTYSNSNDEARKNQFDEIMRAKSLINHVRQNKKYERPYDIVNLHQHRNTVSNHEDVNKKRIGPLRNAYNVINNQRLPDIFFQNREVKLPIERQKTLIKNNIKQFNIVTGVFYEDNEAKVRQEEQKQKMESYKKYWKTHDYDAVLGHYYDNEKQQQYQQQRKMQQKEHGKNFQQRLPPSYHIPQAMQTYDEKRMNAKKRYQLKYVVQDEYKRRNMEQEDKTQQIVLNRVHNGRIQQHKAKEFDIINMHLNDPKHVQELYHRKPVREKNQTEGGKIKTGGFN